MKKILACALVFVVACQHSSDIKQPPISLVWKKSINRGYQNLDVPQSVDVGKALWVGDAYGNVGAYTKHTGDYLWRVALNHGVSAPVSQDAYDLFVPMRDGHCAMLDSLTGHVRWTYQVKGRMLTAGVFSSQFIIIKTDIDHVYVIDRRTGKLQWHYHNDAPSLILYGASKPTVAGESVLLGFASGHLAKMRLKDGKLLWVRALAEPHGDTQVARMRDINAAPIVKDGKVYWAGFQSGVGAYSLEDGHSLWQHDSGSYYDMTLVGDRLLLLTEQQDLMAFNVIDGEPLWVNKQWHGQDDLIAPFLALGHYYLLKGGSVLYEVDPTDGQLLGSMFLGRDDRLLGPLVSDETMLYGLTSKGRLIGAKSEIKL